MPSVRRPEIRVVFACDTTGHTYGYHVVGRAMRDAGFEVVMTGRQLPEEAVRTATDEDADVLAYRIMDRDPVEVVRSLVEAMRAGGIVDIPLVAGGIISNREQDDVRRLGAAGAFGPGSKLSEIIECIRNAVGEKRANEEATER